MIIIKSNDDGKNYKKKSNKDQVELGTKGISPHIHIRLFFKSCYYRSPLDGKMSENCDERCSLSQPCAMMHQEKSKHLRESE